MSEFGETQTQIHIQINDRSQSESGRYFGKLEKIDVGYKQSNSDSSL